MAPLPRPWPLALTVALTACGSPAIPAAAPVSLPEPTPPTANQPPTENDPDYSRALAQQAFGKDALRAALSAYVQAHPYAKQTSEAFTTLGDLEFDEMRRDRARLELAGQYYQSSVAREWTPWRDAYPYYMVAHVARLLGHVEEARVAIERAIDIARYRSDPDHPWLPENTIEEAAVLFADYGAPTAAYDYFRKLSHDDEKTTLFMLERLVRVYEEENKYPESMAIYDALRFHDPQRFCWWTVKYRHASPGADAGKLGADLAKCPQ